MLFNKSFFEKTSRKKKKKNEFHCCAVAKNPTSFPSFHLKKMKLYLDWNVFYVLRGNACFKNSTRKTKIILVGNSMTS